MKRFLFLLLATCILMPSCSKKDYNFNKIEMTTIGGEPTLLEKEEVVVVPNAGMGFLLTNTMLSMVKNGTIEIHAVDNDCIKFVAYSEELLELIKALDPKETSQQQIQKFTKLMSQYIFELCCIIKTSTEVEKESAIAKYTNTYSNAEKIAKTDKFTYYFLYNDIPNILLTDAEKSNFDKLTEEITLFKNNIIVFKPEFN